MKERLQRRQQDREELWKRIYQARYENERKEREEGKDPKRDIAGEKENTIFNVVATLLSFGAAILLVIGIIHDHKNQKELNIREEEAPITGRKRTMIGKPKFELEEEYSEKIDEQYLKMLKEYSDSERLFDPDHVYTILCRAVLGKIVEANPEVQDYKWDVNVCTAISPNALVFPNGRMLVNIGLLLLLENEDELAAILAHEVAHVFARHTAETMIVHARNYHRDQILEAEADHIGLILMTRACYDANQAPGIFKKIESLEREFEEKGEYALPPTKSDIERAKITHPTNYQRFENLTKLLPKAQKEYENSRCSYEPNAHFVTPQFWDHISQTRETIHNKVKQGILRKKENEKLMVERAEEGLEEGVEFSGENEKNRNSEKEKEWKDEDVMLLDDDDEKYRSNKSV